MNKQYVAICEKVTLTIEEAAKLYKVRAVCGIGMGQTGTQLKEVRDKNAILKPPERDWQIKPTVRPKRMIC